MALGNVHRQESVSTILKFVHSTNTLRRKRVALSNSVNFPNFASPVKLCGRSRLGKTNRLENLPQDVLVLFASPDAQELQNYSPSISSFLERNMLFCLQVRILCKVEHRDLKQLLLVSKTVNAAVSLIDLLCLLIL